jgi:general nucleoside transport system permease protein
MDALFTFLYGIPVLGVLFQLLGYLVTVLPSIAPIILNLAAPIALGALCGLMCERSGVVNIGIEGMMLGAAFVAFVVAGVIAGGTHPRSDAPFGATPALVIGVFAGVLTGVVVSSLHAWLSISIRADQIISGTIINVAALGLTGYLNRLIITPNPSLSGGTFHPFQPPTELTSIPIVGWIFNMFLAQGPLGASVIVFVIALQILLFRSRWGLRTRAVGENPRAADTVGINVIGLRYRNVIAAGAFAGLAGAYLTLEATSSFQPGMTSGRGFIALAAVIFGRWTPIGSFGAALLFTASNALAVAVQFQPPTGHFEQLGEIVSQIPTELYGILPYVLTIVVLAGVVGRSIAPAAVGQPYAKESRA